MSLVHEPFAGDSLPIGLCFNTIPVALSGVPELNRPKVGIFSYVSLFRMPFWSILSNSYDWCKWSKACSEGLWVRIVRYRLSGIVDGTLALCSFWRIAFQRVNAIILSSRPIRNPICHRLILSVHSVLSFRSAIVSSLGIRFNAFNSVSISSLPSCKAFGAIAFSFLNFLLTAHSEQVLKLSSFSITSLKCKWG